MLCLIVCLLASCSLSRQLGAGEAIAQTGPTRNTQQQTKSRKQATHKNERNQRKNKRTNTSTNKHPSKQASKQARKTHTKERGNKQTKQTQHTSSDEHLFDSK
jgi:hypothetical protein